MKTLTFKDKGSVEIFKSIAKVTGRSEEQEDGSVILAYNYDEPACEKVEACDIDDRIYQAISEVGSYYDRRIDYIHERIDYVARAMSEHNKGHLPAIKSTSQMETALEKLGLGNEYEVKKNVLWVDYGG